MEKISFFSADFRDGRIRIGNKTYPAGTFATHLLNQYYKDDTAARLAVFKRYSWHLYDTISTGYLDNNDFLKAGWEIQQILMTLPKLQPFDKLDVESERIRISELFTEDNADFIPDYFYQKSQILTMRINESALDLLPIEINKEQQKSADCLLNDVMTTLTFYDRISNDMREAFEGLTSFCDRLDKAERFDEAHLLPIALEIFGNEELDITSEYVVMRKTAKSKTLVTARRMYFDNYYSFVLMDFFEGLHYGHYPRRCPICKRYFLMTSARRQVYCNGTAPYTLKGKTITCRKYAARMKEKERSDGNPIYPIYKSRCSAIRVEQKKKHHHSGVRCNGAEGR